MTSESKCPFPHGSRGPTQSRLVAEPAGPQGPAPAFAAVQSDGRGVRLRQGVQEPRPQCGDQGPRRPDDRFAGLVAGRLRPLRPLFIRMAWHSAGTYRIGDGRGGAGDGQQRFAPLNSWPDNVNLDKARRLLWPIKQKYGQQDFLGRPDDSRRQRRARDRWASRPSASAAAASTPGSPEEDIYWGPEGKWLADERYSGERDLDEPARRRSDGPDLRQPGRAERQSRSAVAAARDIRETFARMAMNDEETVALIAGGHTFGKTHGAADPSKYVGPEPEGAADRRTGPRLEEQLSAAAPATTRSAAASKSPGPRRRPSGATTSSRTCSATSGS